MGNGSAPQSSSPAQHDGATFVKRDGLYDLVLSLHAVHNVHHSPNETYYGTAVSSDAGADDKRAIVTSTQPANLRVRGEDCVILIRVYLHEKAAAGDRLIGVLRVPLFEALQQCGPAIFQTWFLLEDPPAHGVSASAVTFDQERADVFRRSMYNVSRQVRSPRLCLTLHGANASPESWSESDVVKAIYYKPLLTSHEQLMEMTAAYFDMLELGSPRKPNSGSSSPTSRSKSGRQGRSRDELHQSQKRSADVSLRSSKDELDASLDCDTLGGRAPHRSGEIARLEEELQRVTGDANKKIEAGNEAILRLKAEVKQATDTIGMLRLEHEGVQRRAQDARRRVTELRQRLEEQRRPPEPSEDLSRLRQEVLVLTKQKDKLMGLVQDVYGNAKAAPAVPKAASQPAATPVRREGVAGMLLPDPRLLLDKH